MRFTVEIEEFWLDQEEELAPSLRDFVTKDVVAQINKQIATKVEDTVTRQVKIQVQEQLLKKTNKLIDEFIENGVMKADYSGDKPVTVEQYIVNKFNSRNGWGNPKDQIEKLAKNLGDELKNRYDLLFATQIVKKLDKEGLLKDDVANLILDSETK